MMQGCDGIGELRRFDDGCDMAMWCASMDCVTRMRANSISARHVSGSFSLILRCTCINLPLPKKNLLLAQWLLA